MKGTMSLTSAIKLYKKFLENKEIEDILTDLREISLEVQKILDKEK